MRHAQPRPAQVQLRRLSLRAGHACFLLQCCASAPDRRLMHRSAVLPRLHTLKEVAMHGYAAEVLDDSA